MNSSIIDHKNLIDRLRLLPAFVLLVLACFALSPAPKAFGVSPPPDGGYAGNNTAEGDSALANLTSGTDNTAIGFGALFSNTSGSSNTAVGTSALDSNTTGTNDTATGFQALAVSKTGHDNTASGYHALAFTTTGFDNTAIGSTALENNAGGQQNTAVGVNALFNSTSASFNTAIGFEALASDTAGNNTGVGFEALVSNTTGTENTATGGAALFKNINGNSNTANGFEALFSNTTGANNTADGLLALESNSAGHDNTGQGFQALKSNTTGNSNIAVGSGAGGNLTTGSNNIDIGAPGNSGEANTIRVGKQAAQKSTFIAGISGVPVTGSTVVVNSTGKLGVAASSARFKQAIKPMDKASEAILALKPVSFRYKEEIDPDGIPQFGLIAEEVEKVNPDLVGREENGKVNTVRYEAVNAMLLNEFLKAHRDLQELKATVAEQRKQIETLAATVQAGQGLVQPRQAGTANGPE